MRHVGRVAQVLRVATKYGFGYLIEQVGLAPLAWRKRSQMPAEQAAVGQPFARRVALLLEDLGPTFVKLGQAISTRADIFPPDLVYELRKLQDEVEPVPYAQVKPIVEESLGKPIEQVFHHFEPKPLAAASIGQVHEAVTLDGEEVVVKVQRPGIEQIIETDLDILMNLASMAEAQFVEARDYRLSDMVKEFAEIIRDELMFTSEAHNCDRLRELLADDPMVCIPEIKWELTSRRVLVMERVSGTKIANFVELDRKGIDRKSLAEHLGQCILKQILTTGFFHGDPHQGNLLVRDDGVIAFLDFGIVGRLDARSREALLGLFLGIFRQDPDAVVDRMLELGAVEEDINIQGLRREVDKLLAKYYFLPRKDFKIGEIINKLLGLISTFRLRMPPEFALLAKALLITEGICMSLDPDFDFNEAARPLAQQFAESRFSPRHLLGTVGDHLIELNRLASALPRQITHLLSKAEHGTFKMHLQLDRADDILLKFGAIANRLAVSIMLAAIIIASALIMTTNMKPLLWGYPALGLLGFLTAVIMSLWLIISIIRSGNLLTR
ncbi:MAG: phosphotransferase [Armatimonadetes bacterium]|nr:phosphotransferase [Armatimonadota bacterium]